jgi:hypothetical protein
MTTKNRIASSLLSLAMGGLICVGSAAAQTSTPQPATPVGTTSGAGPGNIDPGHPRVNEVNRREENQQKEIGNEIKNGQIGPRRAAHLEREEASIQNQEKRDMAKNNGHLTKQEQGHLNRFENHVHNEITGRRK